MIINCIFFEDKQANSFDVLLNVEEYSSISGGIHTSIGNNEGSMVIYIEYKPFYFRKYLKKIYYLI